MESETWKKKKNQPTKNLEARSQPYLVDQQPSSERCMGLLVEDPLPCLEALAS